MPPTLRLAGAVSVAAGGTNRFRLPARLMGWLMLMLPLALLELTLTFRLLTPLPLPTLARSAALSTSLPLMSLVAPRSIEFTLLRLTDGAVSVPPASVILPAKISMPSPATTAPALLKRALPLALVIRLTMPGTVSVAPLATASALAKLTLPTTLMALLESPLDVPIASKLLVDR